MTYFIDFLLPKSIAKVSERGIWTLGYIIMPVIESQQLCSIFFALITYNTPPPPALEF